MSGSEGFDFGMHKKAAELKGILHQTVQEVSWIRKENSMKKTTGKKILITGAACILGLALCACQRTEETPGMAKAQPEVQSESQPEASPEEPSESQDNSDAPEQWTDSTPDLEGSIKDLKDGQLTVVQYITETADDGGEVMISPAGGDDSEFNIVTVTYDENTQFAVQTIYDGGARAETTAAAAADLTAGQSIRVWGSFSGSSLKADRICMVKVV